MRHSRRDLLVMVLLLMLLLLLLLTMGFCGDHRQLLHRHMVLLDRVRLR